MCLGELHFLQLLEDIATLNSGSGVPSNVLMRINDILAREGEPIYKVIKSEAGDDIVAINPIYRDRLQALKGVKKLIDYDTADIYRIISGKTLQGDEVVVVTGFSTKKEFDKYVVQKKSGRDFEVFR